MIVWLVVVGLALAVFWGWSLLRMADLADQAREEIWLAEDDERRTPNWRRI